MSELISTVTKFEDLVSGAISEKICLTAVASRISGGCLPVKVNGLLVVKDGDFVFQFRGPDKGRTPFISPLLFAGPRKVEPIKWARTIVDGHLKIKAEHIFPGREVRHSNGTRYSEYKIGHIVYEPQKMPRSVSDNIGMHGFLPQTKLRSTNTDRQTSEKWSDDSTESESVSSAALSGSIGRYCYSFRQREDDVEVLVWLKKGQKSKSAAEDLRFFRALMTAFNWMNGGTPFERSLTHRRGHRKRYTITNRWDGSVPKAYLIARDPSGAIGPGVLSITVPFLASTSPLNEAAKVLLWQYRDATRTGSVTLGALLQICSLLEGLVGLILRYPMGLSNNAIDRLPIPPGGLGKPGSAEARFYHAGNYFGFSWPKDIEPVFVRWKGVRNKLAHGEVTKINSASGHEIIGIYHSVLQAFNALLLRTMGYKGKVSLDGAWHTVPYH